MTRSAWRSAIHLLTALTVFVTGSLPAIAACVCRCASDAGCAAAGSCCDSQAASADQLDSCCCRSGSSAIAATSCSSCSSPNSQPSTLHAQLGCCCDPAPQPTRLPSDRRASDDLEAASVAVAQADLPIDPLRLATEFLAVDATGIPRPSVQTLFCIWRE